ncbi:corrinoid protein [Parabacteroides faecis]|uniref:corrinoid protein n=1 Tax=Parabacteroides faecis TaxID=1217282 RepID=UPI002164A3B0|nr:corrinoid protein [Parabacteroides faecis]MCS2891686.1 corrinoid protein [Parabacteroides faecis]UVQ44700.1 corrinoid protein [Parabacteroides faecis]
MADLDKLYEAILTGKLNVAKEVTNEAIAENIDPHLIINNYMSRAMEDIGKRFEEGKAFVPELLMAARAMKGALDLLKPQMKGAASHSLGRVVIGTVKGDLHDIGKNLVASMLEGCGFEVINLGTDISSEKFINALKENQAQILCLSALLTTTMNYMQEVIKALEENGLRSQVKVMVGGAPVSESFARQIGADGYSDNANAAVTLAKSLLSA